MTSQSGSGSSGSVTALIPDLATPPTIIGWTGPPHLYSAVNESQASGMLVLARMWVPVGGTVTNIYVDIAPAGATLTVGQNLMGLYDSSGRRLGVTADQSGLWTSNDLHTMPLTPDAAGSLTLQGARYYYSGFISVGTTPAGYTKAAEFHQSVTNLGLTGASRRAMNLAGQTTLPATLNLGALSATVGYMWSAVS